MNTLLQDIGARLKEALRGCGAPLREDAGPERLAQARRVAEAYARGAVLFYHEQAVEIGFRNVDWTGGQVRHQEWVAQLNRFPWLKDLALLYQADGDPNWARLARAGIEDWMDARGEYGADRSMGEGDTTLNLAIRLGRLDRSGWWPAAVAFADTDAFDRAFTERMLRSTRGQIEALASRLTATGNWRIVELHCLLFCGLVLPGFEPYATTGALGLREAFHRQVEKDGAHGEHTPSYHAGMTHTAETLWRLSRNRPDLPLPNDPERIARMWNYALASETPDGASSGIHDSGVWTPGPGVSAMDKRRRAFRQDAGLADESPSEPNGDRWFPDAGQLFARHGTGPNAEWLSFDATRWGDGHCHLSRLAVGFYARRRMLLYDPGIFSYEMSDPFAVHGKSTPAHNTVTIANGNQSQADPQNVRVCSRPPFVFAQGSYEAGYWPGRYAWSFRDGYGAGMAGRHTRWLLWSKGRYLLVLDRIRGEQAPRPFAAHWQLPPGPVELDADRNQVRTKHADSNMLLRLLWSSAPMSLRVREGDTDPVAGWLPLDKRGGREPAPQAAFEGEVGPGPRDFLTMVMPFGDGPPPEVSVETLMSPDKQPGAGRKPIGMESRRPIELALRWPDGDEDLLLFRPGLRVMAGDGARLRTDGLLALVHARNGRPRSAFMLDGFRLAADGATLVENSAADTVAWPERR